MPSRSLPSAPASGDSISVSISRSRRLAHSCTWRGKPRAATLWLRAWKTGGWTRRLFGRMPSPLTARRGVDSWIASWAAIRANPTPRQASNRVAMTLVTSGLRSSLWYGQWKRRGASSRTSGSMYVWGTETSAVTFDAWVTQLRRGCLQRKKLVRLTNGSGCSFWPTPRSSPNENRGTRDYGRKGGKALSEVSCSRQWRTIIVNEGSYTYVRGNLKLTGQARKWATPTTRDHKDGCCATANVPINSLFGRQCLTTTGLGNPRSNAMRQLNPRFVEWLMGWPLGWTAFERVEMASSLYKQRMRFSLSRTLSRMLAASNKGSQ